MQLSKLIETLTPLLPPLPDLPESSPPLEYQISLETIDSTPYVLVILHQDENPFFASTIPLQDAYYLAFPPSSSIQNHPYYSFTIHESQTSYFSTQEILEITQESAQALHDSFKNFLSLFLPLTSLS